MTAATSHAAAVPRLGYQPALDGLRGVAVLLVMLYHLRLDLTSAAGPVGVLMFFTLSGFLITTLLLEEHAASGRIDLPQFYKRRGLRLLPVLVAAMGLLVALDVLVGSEGDYRRPALLTLLYVANWAIIAGMDFGHINHVWTLAIEEHFYLLWPLTMVLVLRFSDRRMLIRIAVAGALISWGLRVGLWAAGASLPRVLYATDTRLDGLLIGCLLALVGWERIRRVPQWALAAALVTVAIVIYFPNMWFQFGLGYTVVGVATAVIIAACLAGHPFGTVLARRPLVPIGRISYGLYLWHLPVYGVIFKYGADRLPQTLQNVTAVVLSFAIAIASYIVIERPFLRLKRRPRAPDGVPAPARPSTAA